MGGRSSIHISGAAPAAFGTGATALRAAASIAAWPWAMSTRWVVMYCIPPSGASAWSGPAGAAAELSCLGAPGPGTNALTSVRWVAGTGTACSGRPDDRAAAFRPPTTSCAGAGTLAACKAARKG